MSIHLGDYYCRIHNVPVTVEHLKEYHRDAFNREFERVVQAYLDVLEEEAGMNVVENAEDGVFEYD